MGLPQLCISCRAYISLPRLGPENSQLGGYLPLFSRGPYIYMYIYIHIYVYTVIYIYIKGHQKTGISSFHHSITPSSFSETGRVSAVCRSFPGIPHVDQKRRQELQEDHVKRASGQRLEISGFLSEGPGD